MLCFLLPLQILEHAACMAIYDSVEVLLCGKALQFYSMLHGLLKLWLSGYKQLHILLKSE